MVRWASTENLKRIEHLRRRVEICEADLLGRLSPIKSSLGRPSQTGLESGLRLIPFHSERMITALCRSRTPRHHLDNSEPLAMGALVQQ